MSTPAARRVAASLTVVALAMTAACAQGPETSTYVYRPDDSPVDVDTAALRAQKAAAGIAACPMSDAGATDGAHSLPDITLPCLGGGREVNLSGLARVPTVINFWAQSCGPCRAESPLFQQVHEAARGKVAIVGIDFQDTRPDFAIGFADELHLTYPQLADPEGATKGPLQISALPITLFVDASGEIVHVEKGAVESADELATLIFDHLGVAVVQRAGP